ncbi:hypothetical protein GUITHDRAFT_49082, partial [Guillardia theta CCMP2712]
NCTPGGFSGAGASVCTKCSKGYYEDRFASTACKGCENGKYAALTGTIQCNGCPSQAYTNSPSSACWLCSPGTYQRMTNASFCWGCPSGSYATAYGQASISSCSACGPGKYASGTGQSVCSACPLGKYSDVSGSVLCIPCPQGTFAGSTGLTVCQKCSAGSSGIISATSCQTCPLYSSTLQDSSTSLTDCKCPAGYSGPDHSPCTACAVGEYKISMGSDACQYCPSHSTTLQVASNSFEDCKCMAGYTGPDGGPCTACPVGKYKNLTGSDACQYCPSHSTTLQVASNSSEDCTCVAGYTGPDGGPCTACPVGKYKTLTGSDACQ